MSAIDAHNEQVVMEPQRASRQRRFVRQEILNTTAELLKRDDLENITMRRISQEIRYSPTTIYLHSATRPMYLHTNK